MYLLVKFLNTELYLRKTFAFSLASLIIKKIKTERKENLIIP